MDFIQCFYRFQFDDHAIFNQEVCCELSDQGVVV